jgi:hypothetical protein
VNLSLYLFVEIRGDTDPGNPILLRRVNSIDNGGGHPTNGVISDFHMMDPLLQDHAFQQQILQVGWFEFSTSSLALSLEY